jgi:hypothetical protein
MRPELRSFNSLGPTDFERHPVWIRVRSFDFNAPWYDDVDVDDETFRFWDGLLPFAEPRGHVLIAAKLKFKNGSVYPGFLSPAKEDWDAPIPPRRVGDRLVQPPTPKDRHGGSPLAILGIQQPRIFLQNQSFSFWGGMIGISEEARRAFYTAAGQEPEDIFPIHFYSDPQLAKGLLSGQLDGFYKSVKGKPPECFDELGPLGTVPRY